MQTAWSILALALFLTDGSPKNQQEPPGPQFKITFKFCSLSEPAEPKTTVETPEPDTCSKPADEAVAYREPWQLSLPEAIRIALENSDYIRVVGDAKDECLCLRPMTGCLDAENPSVAIDSDEADDVSGPFKADATALVRSVELLYWNVYVARVHLATAEAALRLAEQVVTERTVDLGSSASALEICDAIDRLEQLVADVDRGRSSTMDAEHRLRTIMGLPSSDTRAITPTSDPVTRLIVAGPKSLVRKASRAKRQHHENDELRLTVPDQADSFVQLAREVSADFSRYSKARRVTTADAKRLAHQSRAFQKGRITVGRFLDFVRQYTASVTAEAASVAAYNTTLAALGEASGTLLEMRDIIIADEPDRPESSHAATAKKDEQAKTTAFETARLAATAVPPIPVLPELEPNSEDQTTGTNPVDQDDTEVVFSFSLGGFKCELSVAKP